MAADFIIHIWTDAVTQRDIELWFANAVGSKYFNLNRYREHDREFDRLYTLMANLPSYTVGETSALKAAVFDDDNFLYGMGPYYDLFTPDETPLIDDAFLMKVFALDEPLANWLSAYKGRRCFHCLW